MQADDLFFRITLDALGADVPVADHAFRRQHVDRIIGHALHQQAEALLAGAQRVLGLLALGDVARDLGVAEQVAVLVMDRVDDDAGPETGAVLAHAPALGFVFTLGKRGGQGARRQAAFAVFRRVETREVLPQDLGRLVALEAARAAVPAADVAFLVEHVDRVIANAGDQVLEALFFGQVLLDGYSLVHGRSCACG